MQRLSPRPFRKRPASETETEGRIFFLEVSNETKWLLEPCGAYVKSISRVNSYQKVIHPGTKVRNIWVFSPLVPSKREKNILELSCYKKRQ